METYLRLKKLCLGRFKRFQQISLTNSGVCNNWLTIFDAFCRKVVGTSCFGKLVIMLSVGMLLNIGK